MFKYDLGIIGGMGSEATVEIYKRIINRTKHTCDQEHMKIVILNNSIIPDRTNCILNNGENPLPYLNESIKDLENIENNKINLNNKRNYLLFCGSKIAKIKSSVTKAKSHSEISPLI